MCLLFDSQKTDELRKKLTANGGEGIFYKVYKLKILTDPTTGNLKVELYPPYRRDIGKVKISRNGYVFSNRRRTAVSNYEFFCGNINKGIHVFSKLRDTKSVYGMGELPILVVKVKGNVYDLVGCNKDSSHVVFRKVKLDMESVKKAVLKSQNLSRKGIKAEITTLESGIVRGENQMRNELQRIEDHRKSIENLKAKLTKKVTVDIV